MYFGTLVTRTRDDQDDDNWKRESVALRRTTEGRWQSLRNALRNALRSALRRWFG
jgi:hypothetical protein